MFLHEIRNPHSDLGAHLGCDPIDSRAQNVLGVNVANAEAGKPWDQIVGESNEAYARFLVYRNLGPTRSLAVAYAYTYTLGSPKATKRVKSRRSAKATKSSKSLVSTKVSGQWNKDSSQFQWQARATAWDIEMLTQVGQQTVVKFVTLLDDAVLMTLKHLKETKRKPRTWLDLFNAIKILGDFIPAETVAQIRDSAARDATPAIGAGSGTGRGGESV